MEAASQSDAAREHHAMPSEGRALDLVALSATLHCLTGCAIGEITGMVIGTALGFSDWGTVALAVALAFLFGYTLTSVPLLRAGLALSAVIPIALASDTISIAIREVGDTAIMLGIPGAMEAGLTNTLFWGSLSVALVIAGAFAWPAPKLCFAPWMSAARRLAFSSLPSTSTSAISPCDDITWKSGEALPSPALFPRSEASTVSPSSVRQSRRASS